MNFGGLGNAIGEAVIIGYIAAVLYQENPDKLAFELAKDTRFLEVMIAAYALYLIAQTPVLGPITRPLIVLGVVGAAMMWMSRGDAMNVLNAWFKGGASMTDTFWKLLGITPEQLKGK